MTDKPQAPRPREFFGTQKDHGHFWPKDSWDEQPWLKEHYPDAVHVIEHSAYEELEKECKKATEWAQSNADDWQNAKNKNDRLESEISRLKAELEQAKQDTDFWIECRNSLKTELEAVKKERDEARGDAKYLETNRNEVEDENSDLKVTINGLNNKLEELTEALDDQANCIKHQSAEKMQYQGERDKLRLELEQSNKIIEVYKSGLNESVDIATKFIVEKCEPAAQKMIDLELERNKLRTQLTVAREALERISGKDLIAAPEIKENWSNWILAMRVTATEALEKLGEK